LRRISHRAFGQARQPAPLGRSRRFVFEAVLAGDVEVLAVQDADADRSEARIDGEQFRLMVEEGVYAIVEVLEPDALGRRQAGVCIAGVVDGQRPKDGVGVVRLVLHAIRHAPVVAVPIEDLAQAPGLGCAGVRLDAVLCAPVTGNGAARAVDDVPARLLVDAFALDGFRDAHVRVRDGPPLLRRSVSARHTRQPQPIQAGGTAAAGPVDAILIQGHRALADHREPGERPAHPEDPVAGRAAVRQPQRRADVLAPGRQIERDGVGEVAVVVDAVPARDPAYRGGEIRVAARGRQRHRRSCVPEQGWDRLAAALGAGREHEDHDEEEREVRPPPRIARDIAHAG
jgi:hypothetical protein